MSEILSFVERFGVPVFPCKANAKVPGTARGFHDASKDLEVIRRWAAMPCNWGMPTGPATYVVIDIDVREGIDGHESLAALERQHGRLPDTACVMTPSGGCHYWFRCSEAIPNSAGKLGKGIDVRGDGGYVLIPPSSLDGRPYQWEASSDPADVGFAELPEWAIRLLRNAPKARSTVGSTQGSQIAEGGRNAHLTSLAGSMRRPGMTAEAIRAALAVENATRCVPPLPDAEIATIAASVGRYSPQASGVEKTPQGPATNDARHYAEAIARLYANGLPAGDKTGWPSVDRHYTVVPGQLTIITGWPGSGKSEWLDALLINLARQGWRTAIFSPENKPTELHIAKLMEKIGGRPFGHGPTERLSESEVADYTATLSEWFRFLEASDEQASSIDAVMAAATPWLESQPDYAKRGLVIDPWNELDHWRPTNLTESEYISKTLSTVRNWGRRTSTHVWIVAHPQKMRRDDGGKLPIPRPDMISGAQHWWNKADCAITVYRDPERLGQTETEIYVQKVRFKHVGTPGMVALDYDRITGRYHEQAAFKHIRGMKTNERD